MSGWVILAAPLLIAAVALSVTFVGCDQVFGITETGIAPPEYRDQVLGESSLVSYWRLGEAPGATVAADSKGGNAGTYNGGVTLGVSGLIKPEANAEDDTAAQFDGASGYVSVPLAGALNPPNFTVEALVRIDGGAGTLRTILSSTHVDPATHNVFGYGVRVNTQNQWAGFAGDGTTTALKVARVGQPGGAAVGGGPYYVALTYDGTTLTLYVNPTDPTPTSPDQVGSVAVAIAPNTATELRIGAGDNDGPPKAFFNGVLDEVAIYKAALPYDTVLAHYMAMAIARAPA